MIYPGSLKGLVQAPASKSDFQRACAAALLHCGKTTIYNPGTSDDDRAALQLAVDLGLRILSESKDQLVVESTGTIQPRKSEVFCGESGLATRLFIPIAALSEKEISFTGSGSLLHRPMQFFYETLPQLGVTVTGNGNTLPLSVKGPLRLCSITVDGSVSSQFLSGLLFAFSAAVQEPVFLKIQNAVSQPYLDMTLATLRMFGKNVSSHQEVYQIEPVNFPEKEIKYTVAGDWSSASVWLAAAALGADISVSELVPKSFQADEALLEILTQTGINIFWEEGKLHIEGTAKQGFSCDLTHTPDLFPVLAVLAFSVPGESRISGLHRLRHKESNRLQSVIEMLRQGWISFSVLGDEIRIPGGQTFFSGIVSSFNDHRIVMAATLAAIRADGPVHITGAEAVKKSYPAFFEDLKMLGGIFDFGAV